MRAMKEAIPEVVARYVVGLVVIVLFLVSIGVFVVAFRSAWLFCWH